MKRMMILGSELPVPLMKWVLKNYTHRHTFQHVPPWAKLPRPDGTRYMPQFATDAEWLLNTRFPMYVSNDGKRILKPGSGQCESQPTWPFGKNEAFW